MQIEVERFLDLTEEAGTIVFFDLESVGFHGDYGTIVCGSIKPYADEPYTAYVKQLGNDIKVVKDLKEVLVGADCWVTYYGKGFDIKMINTRLLKHGLMPVEPRPHIDMYYTLKSVTNTSRRSQAHLVSWLGMPEQKMSVSADDWATLGVNTKEKVETLVERCESDVLSLEQLYDRTKHVIRDVRR